MGCARRGSKPRRSHPFWRPVGCRPRAKKTAVPRALMACAARPVTRLVAAAAAPRPTCLAAPMCASAVR
eukprot:1969411-Heterocapsa_arctica.AAC.1